MGLLPEIKGRVNQYYGIKNIRLDPDFSDTAWGFAAVSALFFAGEKKIWKEAFLDSRRRKTNSFAFAEDGIVKDTNSSQIISTHILTVLTICAIVQLML